LVAGLVAEQKRADHGGVCLRFDRCDTEVEVALAFRNRCVSSSRAAMPHDHRYWSSGARTQGRGAGEFGSVATTGLADCPFPGGESAALRAVVLAEAMHGGSVIRKRVAVAIGRGIGVGHAATRE